jgi:hypothetical protein
VRWEYGCRRKHEDEDLEEVPTSPDWGVSAIQQSQRASSATRPGEKGEAVRKLIQPQDSFSLAGMETADDDRETIRQLTTAAELTAKMLEPGRNISDKAGHMERNSPLFFGTGSNPTLF